MSMADIDQENQLLRKIAKILDESRNSYAVHKRKLKDLSNLRSSTSPKKFFSSFSKALAPLFNFPRRIASVERVVRFVATFTSSREPKDASCCDLFLEEFLRFLLSAASAANKTARFRACQIISEIIIWLPDDAEVSNELWDDVIEHMKLRIVDKVPIIRTFAVRGLSRFVNDSENVDILELFLEALNLEQNADVRKTIVLSLPASNATSEAIIDCTRDVSESVRKAAYFVLAKKFPLQSLSIRLRTVILQRGLSDRSPAVVEECLKLMKDEWLVNCCNNDPVELLKFLDVETYESIGDSVMRTLLRAGMVNLHDEERIHQFKGLVFSEAGDSEVCSPTIQLLEPEVALYWRAVCRHLQTEAQAKGSDAAATMGTKAAIYAAEASDKNDLLEKMLPATVSNYVQLVKAHLAAGPSYGFASRQLLLLGTMLDFSDATNRRIASAFVQDLLFRPPEYEMDSNQNMIVIGEDVNLVGDKDWAYAVSQLAKKVHAAAGEFEEVVLGLIEELARPCRERAADFIQWIHCLAVADLLLENSKSFHWLQGKAIEPVELLQSLFIPGAKHLNLDVQRVAVRCLGLYGLLEKQPGEELVKQLRLSFVKGPPPISLLAGKALTDLVMWHGPQEVDRALGHNFPSNDQYDGNHLNHVDLGDTDSDLNIGVLDLLHAGLVNDKWAKYGDIDENGSVQAVLGEGFAKILLLSENYSSIHYSLHFSVLAKLISLYFTDKNQELQRLKQCLSVFFEHYPSLSADHKKHLSRAFIPVVRAMWPGINGNLEGSPIMVSNMRKRAIQASHFMVHMMQAPLYAKEAGNSSDDLSESQGGSVEHPDEFESGEEGLGIRIATEVARFNTKKTSAEKSYASALCKCLVLLHFRSTEQRAIKLMRLLVNCMWDSISSEKELVKDLKHMAEHLRSLDTQPDQELLPDQADLIFGRLELDNPGVGNSMEVPPTPAPRSTRPTHQRRCVRHDETSSDEEFSPSSVVPPTVGLSSAHSQRASKTAAITKMTASRTAAVDHDIDEEEGSELTSEEESDESDYSTE